MSIYFRNKKKYITLDGIGDAFNIPYESAMDIFNSIYPEFIATFKPAVNRNKIISDGVERFLEEHPAYNGYRIARLVSDVFPEFELLLKRNRVLKSEHTVSEWEWKLVEYDYHCAYCGKLSNKLQKDHVLPVSRGGTDNIDNIVPACSRCNQSKFNKMLGTEWTPTLAKG